MNKILEYRGFWARVRYSKPDKCFYGIIEGLKNTAISFEGDTIEELEQDFKDAIDSHLEDNREGRIPERQSIKCPKQKQQLILER